MTTDYSDTFEAAGKQWNVDPKVLAAMQQVEDASGAPKATGPTIQGGPAKGQHAHGLMQFIPETAAKYGVNVNDPTSSIFGAAHYVSDLLDQHKGDLNAALSAYGGDPTGRHGYADSVMKIYQGQDQGGTSSSSSGPQAEYVAQAQPSGSLEKFLSGPPPPGAVSKPAPPKPAAHTPGPAKPPPDITTFLHGPPPAGAVTQTPPGPPQIQSGGEVLPGLPESDRAPTPAKPWYQQGFETVRDFQSAVQGGITQGTRNLLTDVGQVTGYKPMMNIGAGPTPETQAAMANMPGAADLGNMITGTVATAPIAAALEAVPVVAAGAPYVGPLVGAGIKLASKLPETVKGGVRGTIGGSVSNVLTGPPNETVGQRALSGGVGGAMAGAGMGALAGAFGAGRSIPGEVASEAKALQDEGVTDIGLPNVTAGTESGPKPTGNQQTQIDNATSKILHDDIPDWSFQNSNAIKTRLGGAVSQTAQKGQVNVHQPPPGPATPGQPQPTVAMQLNDVRNDVAASGDAELKRNILPVLDRIRAKIKGGILSGQDFDNLVGHGSIIEALTDAKDPYIQEQANKIDDILRSGFKNSSGSDIYDNWVDARARYRMYLGVDQSLKNGHVDPAALYEAMRNKFRDLNAIDLPNNPEVGRMAKFAQAAGRIFGGGKAPAPSPWPGILEKTAATIGIAPEAAQQVVHGLHATEPYFLGSHETNALMAGMGLTAAGIHALGRIYQRSPMAVNRLIARGGRAAGSRVPTWLAGTVGGQILPP